jgi:hypothetical protein
MDRPRLIRGLGIAWSVWWGILCVLLVVLWVRSYWWTTYYVSSFGQVSLLPGDLGVSISGGADPSAVPAGTVIHVSSEAWMQYLETQRAAENFIMGQHWSRIWGAFYFQNGENVPFWFLLAIFAMSSGAPWLGRRFSLRTLFVATTLIAFVLGLVVWSMG